MLNQIGGGNCTLCGKAGTNKSTCPLNPAAKKTDPAKHNAPLAAPATLVRSQLPLVLNLTHRLESTITVPRLHGDQLGLKLLYNTMADGRMYVILDGAVKGTPAAALRGDHLLAINDKPVDNMSEMDLLEELRGSGPVKLRLGKNPPIKPTRGQLHVERARARDAAKAEKKQQAAKEKAEKKQQAAKEKAEKKQQAAKEKAEKKQQAAKEKAEKKQQAAKAKAQAKAPAAKEKSPVAKAKSPAAKAKSPAAKAKSPVAKAKSPAAKAKSPAATSPKNAAGTIRSRIQVKIEVSPFIYHPRSTEEFTWSANPEANRPGRKAGDHVESVIRWYKSVYSQKIPGINAEHQTRFMEAARLLGFKSDPNYLFHDELPSEKVNNFNISHVKDDIFEISYVPVVESVYDEPLKPWEVADPDHRYMYPMTLNNHDDYHVYGTPVGTKGVNRDKLNKTYISQIQHRIQHPQAY